MNTIQEAPRRALAFMLVASMQFAPLIARVLPLNVGVNGWLLVGILLAVTAVLFGIATMLQRLLMPDRRTVFATYYFWAGLLVSLVNSTIGLTS